MKCKAVPLERADYRDDRIQTCFNSALLKGCEEKR